MSTHQAVERLGLPEGRIPLAQATSYLACAIKSNAAYAALGRAEDALRRGGSLPIPMHLRNAPTHLMKDLGYGKGYVYPHDQPDHFSEERNLPPELGETEFYQPEDRGAEAAIQSRLTHWRERRKK